MTRGRLISLIRFEAPGLLVALPLTSNHLTARIDTSEPPTPCAQTRH